jgi:hypothetical protein
MAGCGSDPFFIPVESIKDVPTAGVTGKPLTLTGKVNPGFASKTGIVWLVVDAGKTGAYIEWPGNTLYTYMDGTVFIQAKIVHGAAGGKDYTEDFRIVFSEGSGSATLPTFTSIDALIAWLGSQPENSSTNPYSVKLNVDDITGISSLPNDKYINLDLSGSTFTGIPQNAFYGCASLVGITIGSGVTSIRWGAFSYCTSLTSVTIPNSVTSIGDDTFWGCTSLTSVTIPNSVTSIGDGTFWGCDSLTSVTIPDSVTSIGYHAFYITAWLDNQPNGIVYAGKVAYTYKGNMPAKTSITLLDGTKGIANSAFQGCTNLIGITISNSVINIGESAFNGCTDLTSITIPDSVTSIGNSAFQGCTNLTSVTIPNSVTSIGDSAFQGCTNLTSVTIPNSVTSIGKFAFYKCTSLTSITMGSGVTYIGDEAFAWCDNLTSVTFEGTITVNGFGSNSLPNELLNPYLSNIGGPGTYTKTDSPTGSTWIKG